jgi:xanthine dehydrogenase molybdopterin-binding subunit B
MKKVLFILLVLCSSCYNCEKANIALKGEYLFCRIDSIYRDPSNRFSPSIDITNIKGDFYKGLAGDELVGIFEYGEKGDTIIKEVNSLQYKLIKKDTILYFYPICDCKEVR